MVVILLFLIQARSECCLNCTIISTSECLECDPGYFQSNFTCVSLCGFGYFLNGTRCDRASGSITFIQTDFSKIFLYNLTEAGNFKSSNGLALIEPGNMIPTYDRGFYSDSSSNLIGKSSWVPNTELTMRITFRPLAPNGVIFEGINALNESFIKLSLVSGYVQLEVLVVSQITEFTETEQLANTYLSQATNQWFFLRVLFGQVSSTLVRLDLELLQGTEKIYLSQVEMKITEMNSWVLGDFNKLNTMEGFFYSISVTNRLVGGDLTSATISLCSVYQFEDIINKLCYACQSCNTRLTCVDDTMCSQCYSNQCSSCSGFRFGVCDSCNNTETAPYCCPYLCRQCENLASCTRCHKGLYSYQGICINYAMYGSLVMTSMPLIVTKFDLGFKGVYGVFKTAELANRYHLFNSPEINDPMPAKQRGLFFNGSSYLKNNVVMNFHPIFSLNLVIKPSGNGNMTVLHVGGMFQLQPFLNAFVSYLQTEDSKRVYYYGDSIDEHQNWVSLSLSVTYAYPNSIVKVYKDNILMFTNSVNGIFRQSNMNILIAFNSLAIQSLGSNFKGFVYSFTYWNSEVVDFSQYLALSSCTSQTDANCLSPCEFDEFLNNTGGCSNCSQSCSQGCINEEYCNVCEDRLCSNCTGFYSNCINCINNAGKVAGYCRCNTNTIDYNNNCLVCDSSCGKCETLLRNGCTECLGIGKKLAGGVCYNECPDGFDTIGDDCVYSDGILLDLNFYEEYRFSSINGVLIGDSDSTEIDSNDPVPDPLRGYYFSPGKKMEKFQVLVYYEFSFSFWIKLYSEGNIITHGNLTLDSYTGFINNQIPLNSGNFSLVSTGISQEWSHFIIELNCNSLNISTHSLYKSFNLTYSFTFQANTFFIDSIDSILIGGSTSFTGFIWMISFNNSAPAFIGSSLGSCATPCSACTNEKICLSDCDFQRPADNCSDSCGPACLNCYTSAECQRCKTEGIVTNGSCDCPDRFIWTPAFDDCFFPCFEACLSCDVQLSGVCFGCVEGYFLINNVCVKCPLGYGGDDCVWEKELGFHLVLNEIQGIVVDKSSGLKGQTGLTSRFYPNYDTKDPIFAMYRGYYFDSSFILFKDNILLFAPELTIELWILPSNTSGVIFSKALDSLSLFKINLKYLLLQFSFSTNPLNTSEFINTEKLSINEWNYIQIFVENIENVVFLVSSQVNKAGKQPHGLMEKAYLEDKSSSFFIGSNDRAVAEGYKGFLYEFKVFNRILENNYDGCVGSCLVYSSEFQCLANCSIDSYWNGGNYFNCENCSPECSKGCRDGRKSCSLCLDDLCDSCSQPDLCTQCKGNSSFNAVGLCECDKGFTNHSSHCKICENGYVLNNNCIKCTERCDFCGPEGCLNCTANSEIQNGVCACNLGYAENNGLCSFVEFTVSLFVSIDNFIYLDFSHSLKSNLSENDLELSIMSKQVNLILSQYTPKRYVIKPKINFSLQNETIGRIDFLRKIISINNGLLKENYLNFVLYQQKEPQTSSVMKSFKSFSTKVIYYGTYCATSMILVNPTPASLWSFINSIQMLVYLYLFEIPLSDRFSGYLRGLKHYNMFPNFFAYFEISYGVPHQFKKATGLGFKTNSVLINSGQWISCFLFFIAVYYAMHWICVALKNTRLRQSWFDNFLNNKCQGYKYGFFLRFWIQAYIEILVACFISFYSIHLKSVDQALNLYFSLLLSVISIQFFIILTPAVSFSVGIMKKKPSQLVQNAELKLWGSLFYEFKEDSGAFQNQFYTIFFLRRFFFISIIFVFQDFPMIQICSAEIIMVAVFYI